VNRVLAIAGAFVREPFESFERFREKRAEKHDRTAGPPDYELEESFLQALHAALGAPWPCGEDAGFDAAWNEIAETLTAKGLRTGRGAYGGWDDADRRLAQTVWCLARHLRPANVVETGVGRGLISSLIIGALERNGQGHLSSIDLPPILERDLARQTGAAISDRQRARWTLVLGSSRRRLPGLLRRLGQVDLFVHDSIHTERNLVFEWSAALPFMRAGGVLVADDVHRHHGLTTFADEHELSWALVGEHSDGQGLFAVAAPTRLRSSQL
jgi:predicted O-methyltransferase YrrM